VSLPTACTVGKAPDPRPADRLPSPTDRAYHRVARRHAARSPDALGSAE